MHGESVPKENGIARDSAQNLTIKLFRLQEIFFFFNLSGEAGRGMFFYTWPGAHQQRQEGRKWLCVYNNAQLKTRVFLDLHPWDYTNWMRERLWKRKQTQSLMIVDMDVQDSSESTFASVFFEVFTQLCMRHQSEWTKLEK